MTGSLPRDARSTPPKDPLPISTNPALHGILRIDVENRMQALKEIEQLLGNLTRAEKAQLLQKVARDLGQAFPGIESNPNVCGGEPCIIRTRIPVWVLVQAQRLGTSEAELLRSFPTLRAADLANAWAYAQSHNDEIDEQIRANETA